MNQLQPCPSCQRHVRVTAAKCPFCAVELSSVEQSGSAPTGLRLGRYAAFTFHSGLIATAIGCSPTELVPIGTGGQAGSGGASATGGASGSGGGITTGGDSSVGGEGGEGGEGGDIGTGGDEPGVPIYSAVPWIGPGTR